jgi:murein DD-endopeptidase MepM/ murein hydrolase activator NlpD
VHVVQQGDTLQAIAFDFGVSVEALQRANGVENPQFLQVGQRLVIPRQDEPGQNAPGQLLPTPTPQPIRIQGMGFYKTPVDSLLGLGEVANTTAVTLTNVQVRVTLLDAADEPLMETSTFVSMDLVPAGERAPFRVLFTTPPPDWASYQATVIRGQEAGAIASAYVPLSVLAAEGNPSGPHFQVDGTIKNMSARRVAESVGVFVTTYDAEGAVTGFRKTVIGPSAPGSSNGSGLVDEGLPPGAEVAFSCSLATHGDVPHDFTVTAVGHAAEAETSGG